MNHKLIFWIAGGLVFLVVLGGLGFQLTRATTTQKAQRIDNKTIITEKPYVPILRGGCGLHKLDLETSVKWVKGFNLDGKTEVKK